MDFHSKYKVDENWMHKARLVAEWYSSYEIDYQETFAHVANLNTVRMRLSIAANLAKNPVTWTESSMLKYYDISWVKNWKE